MDIFEGYIYPLTERYQKQRNTAYAQAMSQYMRNQFEFFGIKHPQRRILDKQFIREYGLPTKVNLETILPELWQQTERELQYFAIDLAASCNYYRQESSLDLIEKMIIQRSWWDTVDAVSSGLVAPYFRYFPEKMHTIAYQWIASENTWLQRVAITFQRKYKKLTDQELLFDLIRLRADSKEFFIQKGIGWALREYAYTNPEVVRDFVSVQCMSNLSKREALKHIGGNC
ncbi:DNA alkylation repair protein [Xanthocytophaga agilis]|uniref:DNA alkylation repair protein n=1 Tax=Xanthocytophaga agilis TaxID=3048010 RepID=A0AAE3UBM3_9BACT|nr:DNA alkylation repair protein [Xanthocytophaga agilis]MDJ1499993.1 DNA alkylation repair protein [Xanthocytophaga agilis]